MRNVLLLIILVLTEISVSAQIITLRATVVDEVGAVIPGARVTIRSGERVLWETSTDDTGLFLANLHKGLATVSIDVKASGFLMQSIHDYPVPDLLVADLPQIVLLIDKKVERIEDLPFWDPFPVSSGQPFLSTEILTRPLPSPPEIPRSLVAPKPRKPKRSHY